ncbi:hypothetical protein OP853_000041 [Salmonella enterica]|nr:hypothetical protein [Salmonella enterica]
MYKIKVKYILPEGDVVRVAVCAEKDGGSQVFQMEFQSAYEKGKPLDAYEQDAIGRYTTLISEIAASVQPAPDSVDTSTKK